ncbi:MAG: hypothetical protein IPH44_03150 [Myxococcales bacterium]|nr:hypothetical protein [Myxococcales bacterium]MBK7198318.1 hypothetical protein [Myxococcales bacterium]
MVAVLAQVPAAARFVAGLDAARLVRGPLASRFQGMLAMVGVMMPAACGAVTLSQFDQVVMAGVGTKGDHVVFLGPKFAERSTADCLTAATMGRNGVTVKRRKAFGTTVYFEAGPQATGGALAWSKGSGPIVADHEPWLAAALDPKAAKAEPELVALASSVDHGRTLWLAALLSEQDVAGLGAPPGTFSGPFALRLGVDIDGEADIDVDLVFASEATAAQAADYLRSQFAPMQADGGTRVSLGVHGAEVRLILRFDAASVQRFLAMLPAS